MSHSWIKFSNISFSYGDKFALNDVSFGVEQGELFSVVGPNGGGKSTTFKVLSTLIKPQKGSLGFWGIDGVKEPDKIRPHLGVVFQSPALDKKLTVKENLQYHGLLYGLKRKELKERIQVLLRRFDLAERADQRVEKLSGGLKRRVEISKALLSHPKLLILDEPTTGLDPVARREMWSFLEKLRREEGLTIIFTTHLMEEAEASQRTLLLNEGKVVVLGTPAELKAKLGGDIIALKGQDPLKLKGDIETQFSVKVQRIEDELRIEKTNGAQFIPALVEAFPKQILSVTLGKPSLEDLFIHLTGKKFTEQGETR